MFSSNATQVSSANYIEDVFSTYLYTGNSTTQTITNGIDLAGKGGMVWLSGRNTTNYNCVLDTNRGLNIINTNLTDAQFSSTTYNTFNSFNSNGFTLGSDSLDVVNRSLYNFVSWTFREQPKFFDVVTYTGDGVSSRQISHALASTPGCIIIKCTSKGGTPAGWIVPSDWWVYHRGITSPSNYSARLNTVAARSNTGGLVADSSTFTVYGNSTASNMPNNISGETYVAYLFAHDAGGFGLTGTDNVISCGSYTGNGLAAGPSINLGYEPQWVLIKRISTAGTDWNIIDNMRGFIVGSNGDAELYPNNSTFETPNATAIDPLPTGFQVTTTAGAYNLSGGTYIYIAIRRGPMKVPTSGTSVFLPTASSAAQGTVITTGWPVDQQLIAVRAGNALNFRAISRLQGVSTTNTAGSTAYLSTASTSPESANSTVGRDWNNTGYDIPDVLNTTSCIYYAFQRSPSFMDVVCYTGTGSARTVAHNLGVAPELMIVKSRSNVIDWVVYNATSGSSKYLLLNGTAAAATASSIWNDTSPTSSVFSVGTDNSTNFSAYTYVAYLFATCAGVSKVGSYTGTGTTLQIDCGFTGGARFVLIKRTDSTGSWYVWDSARGIVAGNEPYLILNSPTAEITGTDYVDTYSAGFEISSTAPAAINASGGTYIFLAIA